MSGYGQSGSQQGLQGSQGFSAFPSKSMDMGGFRSPIDYFPQKPGTPGFMPPPMRPTIDYFPQKPETPGFEQPQTGGVYSQGPRPGVPTGKAWTPPGMPPFTPQPPPQQPPPQQPPQTPPPTPQFPGVPQHILSAITTDPSGRMLYGPDKQPVKFEGGKMVFDTSGNTLNPGMGQFGLMGAPGAGGFRLDQSSGRNMILGGANGPQMYNAEGLVQGGQAPQNYVNWLNSYRR